MTIQEALKHSSNNVDRLDVELLLCHVLDIKKEQVITQSNKKIPLFAKLKFFRLVKKRQNNIPLAYLTGHKEFYGLDFLVTKDTLVPRPDTELMVELALQKIEQAQSPVHLIDVGTGTGCIPISVAKNTNKLSRVLAVDVSKKALRIAQKNVQQHNANVHCRRSYLLSNTPEFPTDGTVIITANLPYLTQEEIDSEASIQQEPYLALYADEFGLSLYKELQEQLKMKLKNSKLQVALYMEVNDHQADALVEYTKEEFPEGEVLVHKDLSGKRRVVELEIYDK